MKEKPNSRGWKPNSRGCSWVSLWGRAAFLLGPDVAFCPGPCWEVKQSVLMLAGRASLETGLKEAGFLSPVPLFPGGPGERRRRRGLVLLLSSPFPSALQQPPNTAHGFSQPPTSPGLLGNCCPLVHGCPQADGTHGESRPHGGADRSLLDRFPAGGGGLYRDVEMGDSV